MGRRESLLRHLGEFPNCHIDRSWRGASKSGYMRCACIHRTWPRSAVDDLWREKLLIVFDNKVDCTTFSAYGLSEAGTKAASTLAGGRARTL